MICVLKTEDENKSAILDIHHTFKYLFAAVVDVMFLLPAWAFCNVFFFFMD